LIRYNQLFVLLHKEAIQVYNLFVQIQNKINEMTQKANYQSIDLAKKPLM